MCRSRFGERVTLNTVVATEEKFLSAISRVTSWCIYWQSYLRILVWEPTTPFKRKPSQVVKAVTSNERIRTCHFFFCFAFSCLSQHSVVGSKIWYAYVFLLHCVFASYVASRFFVFVLYLDPHFATAAMLVSAIIWIFILPSSLIAALCMYDLYRRRKRQLQDVEGDLALVCHLAKVMAFQ